jgi:ABC-type transport system involved in multi-copper enzyme maturation permease subunit
VGAFGVSPQLAVSRLSLLADFQLAFRLLVRQHYLLVGFWLVLLLSAFVLLAFQFSARQPATVAMDVGISFIRMAAALFVILLAQELIGREFERRYCLTSLAYPRSRTVWLIGRFAAMVFSVAALIAVMAFLLAGMVEYAGSSYPQARPVSLGLPYLVILAFLMVDIVVVAAVSVLLAVVAVSPNFVLIGGIGFVLLARSYASVIELLRLDPGIVPDFTNPQLYEGTLGALRFIVPDLGGLDVRMIGLYDHWSFLPDDWHLRVAAALSYFVFLLAAAVWVLRRRDFG